MEDLEGVKCVKNKGNELFDKIVLFWEWSCFLLVFNKVLCVEEIYVYNFF